MLNLRNGRDRLGGRKFYRFAHLNLGILLCLDLGPSNCKFRIYKDQVNSCLLLLSLVKLLALLMAVLTLEQWNRSQEETEPPALSVGPLIPDEEFCDGDN